VAPSKTGPDQYQVTFALFYSLMSPSFTAPSSAHEKSMFSQRRPFWDYIAQALVVNPTGGRTQSWRDEVAKFKIAELRAEAQSYFSGTNPTQKNYEGRYGKRHLQTCNVLNYLKWKKKGTL
jgi:hypothetical protein